MSIDFEYDEIKNKELKHGLPYIGYFSPIGNIIDFSSNLGLGSHYSSDNPVARTYLKYISYVVTGITQDSKFAKRLRENNIEQFKDMSEENMNELVFRGLNTYFLGRQDKFEDFYGELLKDFHDTENRLKTGTDEPFDRFKYDMLRFFISAYKNGDYLKSLGEFTRIDNINQVEERVKGMYLLSDDDKKSIMDLVDKTVSKEVLSGFKDICVKYLGYDSIERFNPKGEKIIIPGDEESYDKMFYSTPRVITTSHIDYCDRFYNYLLMDWEVYKVPKYEFDEGTGKFREQEPMLSTLREERDSELVDEIRKIKKKTPPHERKIFFK